jgi:hypothetical protein
MGRRTNAQNKRVIRRSTSRFLLQAAFLIAAAATAAAIHLGTVAIVLVMAAAFAAVVVGEWLVTRERAEPTEARPAAEPAPEPRPIDRRRVVQPARPQAAPLSPRPLSAAAAAPRLLPGPPEPEVRAEPLQPRPVAPASALAEAPAPAPPPRPVVPPPAPPPPPHVPERRRWNVFDLQNRARQVAGRDPARDEELSFLLLYLREFADVAGDLSEDFDPFVRASFADLIAT